MDPQSEIAAVNGPVLIGILIVGYVIFSWLLKRIGDKAGTEGTWLAWVPIIGWIVLPLMIAEKPMYWFLLQMIPFLGIIFTVMVWMGVSENRGKPGWMGILMLVPGANVFFILYLAFSD